MQMNAVQRAPSNIASSSSEALENERATNRIAIVNEHTAVLIAFGSSMCLECGFELFVCDPGFDEFSFSRS